MNAADTVGPRTFLELWARWPDCPPHGRSVAFGSPSQTDQDACWQALAVEERQLLERENEIHLEPARREKRRTPSHGTPTSTSTGTGRVQLSGHDTLKSIPAATHLPARVPCGAQRGAEPGQLAPPRMGASHRGLWGAQNSAHIRPALHVRVGRARRRISVFELARIMGSSVQMIERHYGTLLDRSGAGIAGPRGLTPCTPPASGPHKGALEDV